MAWITWRDWVNGDERIPRTRFKGDTLWLPNETLLDRLFRSFAWLTMREIS